MINKDGLICYKTNGAFETFDLNKEFLQGLTDTTGLGQLPQQAIEDMVQQDRSNQSQQGNQQGQQNGQQSNQSGTQQGMQNGQGANAGQQGSQSGMNSQGSGGSQPGAGSGSQGNGSGTGGNQSGQQIGGSGGLGNLGTPSGKGGPLSGLSPFDRGQSSNQGNGSEQSGMSGSKGGSKGGSKASKGTVNQDPNSKSYSPEGSCRRPPFCEENARLGAQAIYEQRKYFKDVDDSPKIAKNAKKAIQDYRDTINGVKSVMDRTRRTTNTYDMGVEGHIKKTLAPKVNWRALLERFISKSCEAIMTYSRPDRRFVATQVLPGPKFTDDMIKDMVIGIDTSGSISDAELAIAAGHIWNIFKKYKVNAEVAFWDTICSGGVELKNKSNITNLPDSPHTGGTNVDSLFQWVNTRMKGVGTGKNRRIDPSVIIIFTDGEFPAPTVVPKCGGDKVIWVLTTPAEYHKFQVPFGQKAIVDFNNLE